ncbi:MAG: tol-pal system protein YbgF, partial [Gammaproteobacteria bacterium]|nr:tol-pal system protein YbgF [Gammaproteobacteria bacterium]
NKELESRADATDQRLGTLESRVNQSLLDLQQQIEKSQQELRTLRGQIEEARHQLESVQQQQRDLYGDIDRRLLVIENGAGGGAPVAAGGATRAPDAVFADESSVYGDAFAAMKAGRYEEAARGFQMYLAKYPRGPRADNATYWLGEAQFVQSQFDAALKSYQAVAAFPESRRLADAMYKVALCQYELKAFKNARATLNKVISTYPESEAAKLAQVKLGNMNTEGR